MLLTLVGAACAAALPAEAPAPVEEAPAEPEAPAPVEDTEEVAQAKAEFDLAFKAAAAAAEAGEVPEVIIPEGAPAPVEDTPEVAAAKAEFQAAFDAAASAAEAAPDFDLDGTHSAYTGFLSTVDGRLSPFYTNTFPLGAYGLHAPIVAPASPIAPITYNNLGLGAIYGYPGVYGFPYGYPGHLALAPAVEAEEPAEEVAVEEA